MMHDPRHWRLTLIYKAMFNVIFLFFFYKSTDGCMAFEAAYMLEKICVSVFMLYMPTVYIYLLQIGLKFDCQSTSCCFSVQGTELFVCFFPPFHIEGILLKVWYSWFKEVARHEPKKQQHIFRDVLPTLLTLFFLFLPFVTSSLTEHHLSPSSLREIYACSLLRSSSLLGSFLTST